MDNPEEPRFSVKGEVVKSNGTPLARHVVRAFDRALGDWRQLGALDAIARTDERGRYAITYDPAQLTQWGKTRADLKVEVYDPSGDEKLAESPLILQALPREVVNLACRRPWPPCWGWRRTSAAWSWRTY